MIEALARVAVQTYSSIHRFCGGLRTMSAANIPAWLPIADIVVSAVSALAALLAALAAKSAAQSALAGIREMKAARTQSVRPILNVDVEERFFRFFKGGGQENVDPRSRRQPKLSIKNIGTGSAISIRIEIHTPDMSSNMPDKVFAQKSVDLLASWGHSVRLDYDGVCFTPEGGGFFTWLYPNEFKSTSSNRIEVCGADRTVESRVLEQFTNSLAVIQIARWGAGLSEPLTVDLPLTLSYSTISGEQEKIPMSLQIYLYGVGTKNGVLGMSPDATWVEFRQVFSLHDLGRR